VMVPLAMLPEEYRYETLSTPPELEYLPVMDW